MLPEDNILCSKCQHLRQSITFPCTVCQRHMAYFHCLKCDKPKTTSTIDICSPKCQQIFNGKAHIIPIEYNHQTVMMVEEFDDLLGLKVVNHTLLNQVLTHQQKENMGKQCEECKKGKYKLLPYKCWSCKDVYTYEIECPDCYNENGYLCDECDFEINK